MAFLRLPPNAKPRPRASVGAKALRSTLSKEPNNMNYLPPRSRQGNVYYPSFRRPPNRTAEGAAFDALTVQVALKRLDDGTLDPKVLVALLSAVGVEQ
jgi:hypothetical protein